MMKHRIGTAITCLHISALLYGLLGLVFLFFVVRYDRSNEGLGFAVFLFAFLTALIAGIEVVAYGLRLRKFWAWIAGLIVFAAYVPSLFLPLGVLGLRGLLDEGSRAEFGMGTGSGPRE